MKVKIKNYQAINSVDLLFEPGITAIVGESNNGKSSIIRAIEAAINNKGGNSFISYDAKFCTVEIEDQGSTIIWKKHKGAGKSSYIINGTELSKIGQKQIPEVAELLKMPEILVNGDKFRLNFWKQLDYPFLVGKNPYQLFDFISNSKEQELLFSMQDEVTIKQKEYKDLISSINSKIDLKTDDINISNKKLDKLSRADGFDLDILERLISIRDTIVQLIDSYKMLLIQNEAIQKKIVSLTNTEKKLEKLMGSIDSYLENAGSINETLLQYASADLAVKIILDVTEDTEKAIVRYSDSVKKLDTIIATHSEEVDKHKVLSSEIVQYKTYEKNINTMNASKEMVLDNIKKITEELASFKVCPLCGGTLDNTKHTEGKL